MAIFSCLKHLRTEDPHLHDDDVITADTVRETRRKKIDSLLKKTFDTNLVLNHVASELSKPECTAVRIVIDPCMDRTAVEYDQFSCMKAAVWAKERLVEILNERGFTTETTSNGVYVSL